MKTCFKIHPDDYDKRANEEFYEKMAEEGWILKKRWNNLSQFEKTEPRKLKFDIYYSENNFVSEEERQEFHSKGRAIVDVKSHVHVSYSPTSEHFPPVIKSNEDAAKAVLTLKNRKTILPSPVILVLMISILNDFRVKFTYNVFEALPFLEQRIFKIITMPELYIAMLIIAVYIVIVAIYEHIRWKKAVAAFHNGENPDDGNRKKVLYIFSLFMTGLSVVFIALFLFGDMMNKEQDLPEVSDGIYLDVHDFGIADKITEKGLEAGGKFIPCEMKQRKTLSADMILTQEFYYINDTRIMLYQDIISYRTEKTALYAAELLSKDKHKNYTEITAEGFSKIYVSDENLIAVIDSTVYRITMITESKDVLPSTEELLEIILAKN